MMQSKRQIRKRNNTRRNALRTLRRRDTVGLLLFGSCESGKSALVTRWIKGDFNDSYVPTVEDFYVKSYRQCANVGIIDMSGSGDFAAMTDLYLAKIDSVMFIYDIGADSTQTVNNLKRLHELLIKVRGDSYSVLLTVVGTKIDRNQDRGDNYHNTELAEYLEKIGIPEEKHILTSAKLDRNVEEAFESALNEVVGNMMPSEDRIKRSMKDKKTSNSWIYRLCCCLSIN